MKRVLTAVILIALVGVLVFFGKLWMVTLFAAVVAGLAQAEFFGLARQHGNKIPRTWRLASTALFFLAVFFRPQDTLAAACLAVFVLFAWSTFGSDLSHVLGETASGALSLLYIAYPLCLVPGIWAAEDGTALLLFLFLCVWSGDIAALYIGKRFGRRKLAPRLSPNKTWEGAIASVGASVLFGVGLILFGNNLMAHGSALTRLHTTAAWWQFIPLAVLLNVAAQIGDLVESALKRGAGVKDSGTLLPGHGGVLDRIDALLLAAPVLWFCMLLREYLNLRSF